MAEIVIRSGSLSPRDVWHLTALHKLIGQDSGKEIKIKLKTKKKFRKTTTVRVSFSPEEKLHDTGLFCEQMCLYLTTLTGHAVVITSSKTLSRL